MTYQMGVLTGLNGVGKNTVMNTMLEVFPDDFGFVPSFKDREPRPTEGVNSVFVEPKDFSVLEEQGFFCEVESFLGHRYGMPKLENIVAPQQNLLCEMSIRGASRLAQTLGSSATVGCLLPDELPQLIYQLVRREGEASLSGLRARILAFPADMRDADLSRPTYIVASFEDILRTADKTRRLFLGEHIPDIVEEGREKRHYLLPQILNPRYMNGSLLYAESLLAVAQKSEKPESGEQLFRMRDGALVVLTDMELKAVLLIKLHDPSVEHWTLPGGGSNPDEDPADTAFRELQEEVGVGIQEVFVLGEHTQPYEYFFDHATKQALITRGITDPFDGQRRRLFVAALPGMKKQLNLEKKSVAKAKWVERDVVHHYLEPVLAKLVRGALSQYDQKLKAPQ